MLTCQNVCILWALLLPLVTGGGFKFNLHKQRAAPQEGDLRLSGSQSVSEGRVEVFHNSKWGTVCDDGWDMAEAQVVCRQLRFPGAKSVVTGKDYGEASGPIWLDDITCKGNENYLSTCAFKDWGVTDCTHKEDVGVICQTESSGSIREDSRHFVDNSFSLSDDLGKIFDSGSGCDFLILVQSATGSRLENGTQEMMETPICVHKMILSLFPAFNVTADVSNLTVEVSESCQPYVSPFIRYIYTRKIDVTMSSVQCLHWMASSFGLRDLMEGTARLFSKVLPEDASFHTQVSIYKYAQETEDLVLQENCIQFLAWNFENLTRSEVWGEVSVELVKALLARSDLVVQDEYYLLETLEKWIIERSSSIGVESQVDLLNQIRFPMIPVDKLYALEFNSSLYNTHKILYRDQMLKSFQYNIFPFRKLISDQKFNRDDEDYQLRLYTSKLWSIAPGYPSSSGISVPLHNSQIYKDKSIYWEANLYRNQYECSNRGLRCKSLPMMRFYPHHNYNHNEIRFQNQLLVMCQGKYISHVQDFKENLAYIGKNGSLTYPCADDNFIYRFIVRPEYVI